MAPVEDRPAVEAVEELASAAWRLLRDRVGGFLTAPTEIAELLARARRVQAPVHTSRRKRCYLQEGSNPVWASVDSPDSLESARVKLRPSRWPAPPGRALPSSLRAG